MSFFTAILLGILQGLTEFIPVSSSGHLVLAQHFLGIQGETNITFEVFLHLGTLVAVVLYFYKQVWELVISLFSWRRSLDGETHRKNRCLVSYIIIATLTTMLFYLLFSGALKAAYGSPLLVACMLAITGGLIFSSDYIRDPSVPASNMGVLKSVFIGLGQGLAIMPGISRSGTTIAVSLYSGIKRKDAAQFSFLLSIPAILGANVSEFSALKALDTSVLHVYLAGFFASFIVGYLVIAFLIRMIQAGQLKYFAFYCWFIASLSITSLVI